MNKGGTQAPVKRKTSGHKIGDTVRCISSGSSWHKVGDIHTVVEHPNSGLPSVPASDGFFDELVMAVSRFESLPTKKES